jgi:elongation factor Ts
MATITAGMVAELRAKTDAPMMECKRALTEAEGDMVKAEELLRVKLGSKASKASARVTAEGVVTIAMHGGAGAMLEVNCETDFVTKNDSFLALANAAVGLIAAHQPADVAALSALAVATERSFSIRSAGTSLLVIATGFMSATSMATSLAAVSLPSYSTKTPMRVPCK